MILTKKKEERELLDPNSGVSSIRYVMLQIVELIRISLYSILIIFAYKAYDEQTINWEGAAYFIGSLAILLTGVTGTKAYQKKAEANKPREEYTEPA